MNNFTFDDTVNDSQWDSLVLEIPSANIFHSSAWLNFIGAQFSLNVRKYVIRTGNEIAGIIPLCMRGRFPVYISGSPLIAENNPYMGFALKAPCETARLIPSFERLLKKNGISFLRITFDNFDFAEEFRQNGYELIRRETLRLDLTRGDEELWNGMDAKCRNKARKGEKGGCTVREVKDEGFIEPYYSMSAEVYGRQKLPTLLTKDYYENIFRALHPRGLLRVFINYSPEDKPMAGAIILLFKKKAYYLDGVSFREYSKLAPGNFLQWHIISTLANEYHVTFKVS